MDILKGLTKAWTTILVSGCATVYILLKDLHFTAEDKALLLIISSVILFTFDKEKIREWRRSNE